MLEVDDSEEKLKARLWVNGWLVKLGGLQVALILDKSPGENTDEPLTEFCCGHCPSSLNMMSFSCMSVNLTATFGSRRY